MSKTETRVVYYNVKQITIFSGQATVKLFSDRDRKNVVGQALYVTNSYENRLTGETWSKEGATFFLEGPDTISFEDNSKTSDGVLPEGRTIYSIINGQGKYLGATGTVEFDVNKQGLRTMTITAKLA